MKTAGLLATRRSLVDRLANWDDQRRWQDFFDTYWKLIYSAAQKSGLTDSEAQEVVQETVITVAKKIDKLRYDPALGSFKGWLLQITRWRIADQFRKRDSLQTQREHSDDDRKTATIERLPDLNIVDLDVLWEREWQENLFTAARSTASAAFDVNSKACPAANRSRVHMQASSTFCMSVARATTSITSWNWPMIIWLAATSTSSITNRAR